MNKDTCVQRVSFAVSTRNLTVDDIPELVDDTDPEGTTGLDDTPAADPALETEPASEAEDFPDPDYPEPVEVPEEIARWIEEELRKQKAPAQVDDPIPKEFDGPVINKQAAIQEVPPAPEDSRQADSYPVATPEAPPARPAPDKATPSAGRFDLPPDSRDVPQSDLGDLFNDHDEGNTNIRPDIRFVWDAGTDTWRDHAGRPLSPLKYFRGRSVFSLLGIHGCRAIEDYVIAGMALGEPVLLIGAPGSAKTAMTERLASDMHLRFWAYDASKAMFEDIVGFPDPASLGRGEVRYVPTPLSLMGKQFVLVDEVSRAHPALQNKWLEIIRSRRVMGIDLPDLQMVFGAMNPPGLAGTVPLDEALAGRFTFHIQVPDINAMSDGERRSVIEAGDRNPIDSGDRSSRIRWIVRAAREAMAAVETEYGSVITTYVAELSRYLAGRDWKLDGRRQGMIRRGLIAYVATRSLFMEGTPSPGSLSRMLRVGIEGLLPFDAVGRDLPRVILDSAHQYAGAAMAGNVRSLPPSDLLMAADMVARGMVVRDGDQLSMLVTRILQTLDRAGRTEERIKAGAALLILGLSPEAMRHLPIEARQRVIVALADSLELESDKVGDFLDESFKLTVEGLEPQLQEPVARVSYNIIRRRGRHRGNTMEFEQAVTLMTRYIMEGGVA
ncbi:MAG TPA: MoxR family ATPase [Myxococcota bacterium]|nr:MoxR family ATPase [Myxococcota bacterium]